MATPVTSQGEGQQTSSFNPLRRGGGMATGRRQHAAAGYLLQFQSSATRRGYGDLRTTRRPKTVIRMFQSSATRRGYGDAIAAMIYLRSFGIVSILCDEEGVWRRVPVL